MCEKEREKYTEGSTDNCMVILLLTQRGVETERKGLRWEKKIWHLFHLSSNFMFVLMSSLSIPLPLSPFLPVLDKTGWLYCRLELQNKSHLVMESVEIPTESERERQTESGSLAEWKESIARWKKRDMDRGTQVKESEYAQKRREEEWEMKV